MAIRLLAAAAFLLPFLAATPGRGVELVWRLDAGDELQIVVERDSVSRSGAGETLAERTSRQELHSRWKCLGRNARGQMEFEARLTRAVMKQSLADESTRYDSDEPATDALAPDLAAIYGVIVDLPFHVVMESTGAIASSKLPDETVQTVRLRNGRIARYRGVSGMRATLGMGLPVLKRGDLAPGASWTAVQTANNLLGGTASLQSEYRIDDDAAANGVVRIAVARTALARAGAGEQAAAFELKSFQGSGELLFDLAGGRVVSETIRDETVLHVDVPDSPPQEVRTKSEKTTRVSLVEREE